MAQKDENLLARIAKRISEPDPSREGSAGSILTATAERYTDGPVEAGASLTAGFDPEAAALFEAVVEAAYLVANADGVFDETEQAAFHQVVHTACGDAIPERQIAALLTDLAAQLEDDGIDKRVKMVARTITGPEQAREVLRVAAFIAFISEGVSEVEREVMLKLAGRFGLGPEVIDEAVQEVERALAG